MSKKILHIAPVNSAGVPYMLMQAERELGCKSRLITRTPNPYDFPEDICLDLPLTNNFIINFFRGLKERQSLSNKRRQISTKPPFTQPSSLAEAFYKARDKVWHRIIKKKELFAFMQDFDYIILDGGSGLLYSSRFVKELNQLGKKIISIYYGSDLRTRGVIPAIDKISAINFSFEFDHTALYPGLIHLPFPFDSTKIRKEFSRKESPNNSQLIIGHSPTKFHTKGSAEIITTINELQDDYDIRFILIHDLPHQEAMELKSHCDIFIDQLGELGYGISGLEALALGIPTVVTLKDDYLDFLGEHPFVNANAGNLKDKLIELISDAALREQHALAGPPWLERQHSPQKIAKFIIDKMEEL